MLLAPEFTHGVRPNMEQRKCKDCGASYLLNRDNFGNTPSGGFRWQCRSCMRNHVKKYTEQNPEWIKEKHSVRLARIEANGGRGISFSEINKIRRELRDCCAYCGIPLQGGGEVDHMTPIARGGRDEPTNATLACTKCNLAKHAKTVEEYLQWRKKRGLIVREPNRSNAEPPLQKKKLILVRKIQPK